MENKVKYYREKAKLTQEELAVKSGVSRTTISALENESLEVTTNATMSKIAKILNVKVSKLFFLE